MIRDAARISSVGRAIIIAHLFLSPLVFWRATSEPFESNKLAILLLAGAASAALAITALAIEKRRLAALDLVSIAVVAFFGSAVLSTTISISPRTSFWGAGETPVGLLTVIGYMLLFFATRAFFRDVREIKHLLIGTLGTAALTSVYALVQTAGFDPFSWEDHSTVAGFNRPFSTFGHPNFLGAYLAMAVPIALEFARAAAAARQWRSFGLAAVVAALSVAAIIASLSRAAWLALAVAWVVLAIGWYLAGKRRASLAIILVPLVLVAGTLLLGSSELRIGLGQRVQQLDELGSRRFLWAAGWLMFLDHPVVGYGLDTFQIAFAGKRTPEYWAVEWNTTPAKAHNELIQILATQGLFGGVATVILLIGIAVAIFRSWKHVEPSDRGMTAAITAAVVGFVAQSYFGFTVIGCGSLLVTLIAILSRLGMRTSFETQRLPASVSTFRWIGVGATWFGAVLLCVYGAVMPIRASIACANGERTLHTNSADAVNHFEKTVDLEPWRETHWVKLGSAAHVSAKTARSTAERVRLLQQALIAYSRAVELVPANSYNHANVGRITAELAREKRAQPEDAFAAFERALALDPNNAYIHTDAANAALALGDVRRSTNHAICGLERYPTFGPLTAIAGYAAMQQGRLADATAALSASLSADWHGDEHGRHFAWNALTLTLMRQKRFHEAAAYAWGMTQRWPERPDVYCIWARALESAGLRPQAIHAYQLIVRRWPENREALDALRRLI